MRRASSTLIGVVLVLLTIGIVILASTSSVKGDARYDDPYHFVKKQAVWLVLGMALAAGASRFDYHWWRRLVWPLLGLSVVLLILVFVPGIGVLAGGSHRWIRVAGVSLQPSELARFSVVLMLAAWMTRMRRKVERLWEGLLVPMGVLGVILVLLFKEPDWGTAILTASVGMIILFVAGTRLRYLVVVGVLGACLFALALMHDPERLGRVLGFLWPDKYPAQAYHLKQSKVAFMMGGPFGVGLNRSLQKYDYLPEAHTDFIFAILGEELGMVGSLSVLLLYTVLFFCGVWISGKAPDMFGRLLGFGLTAMLAGQATINMGVVTGCLPTKGLPLPFVSYGGSNLVMSLVSVGVLLNIAYHAGMEKPDAHTRMIQDRHHWA